MSNYLCAKPTQDFNPSAGNFVSFAPSFKSGFPLVHQLVNQFSHFFWNAYPLINTQHAIVVPFIICLFEIIKSNSKIPVVLLDFFHNTSVNYELVNSQLPFIPDFVHAYTLQSVPLIFCKRNLSTLLVCSSFHNLSLQFFLISLSFISATTPVSYCCERLFF